MPSNLPSIEPAVMRRLTERRGAVVAYSIALQWVVIVATMVAAVRLDFWWFYPIAVIVIATRQHALGVLMHDAAHYILLRNRRLNNWVSDFFLALPLGVGTAAYRRFHLGHHRHLNTERDPELQAMEGDPDWVWPKSPGQALRILVMDGLGCNLSSSLKIAKLFWPGVTIGDKANRERGEEAVRLALFALLLVGGVTYFDLWFEVTILWIVPALTVMSLITRMRALGEHQCLDKRSALSSTRTVIVPLWERLFLAPLNVSFHLEHHLYPKVPCYNLKALHALLMHDETFAQSAAVTRAGYFSLRGVLGELTTSASRPQVGVL